MAFTNKKKKYDTDSVVAGVDDVVTSNNTTPAAPDVKPSGKTVTVPVVTANDLLNPPVEKKKKLQGQRNQPVRFVRILGRNTVEIIYYHLY